MGPIAVGVLRSYFMLNNDYQGGSATWFVWRDRRQRLDGACVSDRVTRYLHVLDACNRRLSIPVLPSMSRHRRLLESGKPNE